MESSSDGDETVMESISVRNEIAMKKAKRRMSRLKRDRSEGFELEKGTVEERKYGKSARKTVKR